MLNWRKKNPIVALVNDSVVDLATPTNISRFWNLGFMLFLCLILQLVTGILLSMDYAADVSLVFHNLSHTSMETAWGWMLRNSHASVASLFFFSIYLHIFRGIYFNSFSMKMPWVSGITMLLCLMATAFLGYVLPWGQMSFWGATVITNLFSAIPIVGPDIVQHLWGSFSVSDSTLKRFYSLHFALPFILLALSIVHVFFLHETGSFNSLGISSKTDKMKFYPFSALTDTEMVLNCVFFLFLFVFMGMVNIVNDPDNYNFANPMMAPPHIQPEWYFLFAYAILRAVPNKLGGVIALTMSILILYSMPFTFFKNKSNSSFYPASKLLFWCLVVIVLVLTFIGAQPVEEPYILTGQVFSVLYFSYFMAIPLFKS